MGFPAVQGDSGSAYFNPATMSTASFPLFGGSVKTFVGGKSIALLGQANTAGGPIIGGAPTTVKTFVEGKPVYLIGAVTNLATGWIGGTLTGAGAGAVQMT